jgi:O-acetylserine/cysteine efflux transporter
MRHPSRIGSALPSSNSASTTLPLRHLLLGVAAVAIWGTNFVVIKIGLAHLPPLLFAALRFTFAFFPALFFFPFPKVGWRNVAAYGLLLGVGLFGLLFIAIRADITPGLASLVVQCQVFFTIGLAVWRNGEKVQSFQWAALLLAVAGIVVIASHTDGHTTATGLLLVITGALCWACGNLVNKAAGQVNMVAYIVWSSAFSVPPLLLLSWIFEGGDAMLQGLQQADAATWAAVLWQSVGNALFGYAAWGWLLARYPAASVAPLALLVPVFGMGAAALFLGESLPMWKLSAAALVLGGLAINLLWPRWKSRMK